MDSLEDVARGHTGAASHGTSVVRFGGIVEQAGGNLLVHSHAVVFHLDIERVPAHRVNGHADVQRPLVAHGMPYRVLHQRLNHEGGHHDVLDAVLDANVSVMIAAIVLIVMGSGTVKGFAVNLALGLVVSMFTAIVVSRSLLTWFINTGLITNPWFYGLNRKPPEHMLKKGGQK